MSHIPSISSFTGANAGEIPVANMGEMGTPVESLPVTPPATPSGEQIPTGTEPTTVVTTPVETPPAVPDPVTLPNTDIPPVSNNPVIEDTHVLGFLSEKLGRKIENFEELKPQAAPELDPSLKAIADWRERTGRPLEDWVKFQKDPSTLTDLEVVRESLRLEYPTLTDAQLQLEIEANYLSSEDDLDNEKALKDLKLAKQAIKGRETLNNMRLQFDTPATISYPKEIQEDLALAQQIKAQASQNEQFTKQYNTGLQNAATSFEKLSLNLAEGVSIDFTVPAEERVKLPDFVNTMPHWKNADGSTNHQAVVQDAIKIQNFDKLLKIAYDQGLSAGTDRLAAEASNITLDQRTSMAATVPQTQGYKVEGFDKMIGGSVIRIKG